jgi:cysteinyl-tRNA synthetase
MTGREIRYWLISRHYRKPVSFSWASLEASKKTIANLDRFIVKLRHCRSGASRSDIDQLVYNLKHHFTEALDDDLNVAPALAAVFQFTKEINRIMSQDGLSSTDKEKIEKALRDINSVLGVMNLDSKPIRDDVEKRLKKREAARKSGDWDTADQIRKELKAKGIEVIDTKEGTIWRLEKGSFNE